MRVSPADGVPQGALVALDIHWGAAEPPGRDLATRFEFVNQKGVVA